jgi:hypothetical protein
VSLGPSLSLLPSVEWGEKGRKARKRAPSVKEVEKRKVEGKGRKKEGREEEEGARAKSFFLFPFFLFFFFFSSSPIRPSLSGVGGAEWRWVTRIQTSHSPS